MPKHVVLVIFASARRSGPCLIHFTPEERVWDPPAAYSAVSLLVSAPDFPAILLNATQKPEGRSHRPYQ